MGRNLSVLRIFADWWWVIALMSITYMLYAQSIRSKQLWIGRLNSQIEQLEDEKATALLRQEELSSMITSQSDPAWIEMTLMKQMGVVPEGKRKVRFE